MDLSEFSLGRILDSDIISTSKLFKEYIKRNEFRVETISFEKFRIDGEGANWFFDVLEGERVVGVDGSQLRPLKEFGLPFGAVQAAKIAVVHGMKKFNVSYRTKWLDSNINLDVERFELEIGALLEEMDSTSHLFVDGSLILSFVSQFNTSLQRKFIALIDKFLEKSEETATPVFGFIERSYAKDMVGDESFVYDSLALGDHLEPMEYTEPLRCERKITEKYSNDVYFCYLKLNPFFPVRVEFPEWMKKDHRKYLTFIAAECAIGSTKSYPYILERAHRYATISENERKMLASILGIGTSFKWMSKRV